ncbi:unnamed protein product [Paramecium sonneborni]|uniref:Uncharacterized protein n=1 Tax=Paramecium sonneborni TaxID=65129 RepID=A0A8S1NKD4_9CILI|nr:unnamed protein product [Paramecium sonneborni]
MITELLTPERKKQKGKHIQAGLAHFVLDPFLQLESHFGVLFKTMIGGQACAIRLERRS